MIGDKSENSEHIIDYFLTYVLERYSDDAEGIITACFTTAMIIVTSTSDIDLASETAGKMNELASILTKRIRAISN